MLSADQTETIISKIAQLKIPIQYFSISSFAVTISDGRWLRLFDKPVGDYNWY